MAIRNWRHRYSHVRNYVKFNQAAVKEMYRQVGDLVLDARSIAQRGLLLRHLVLPENIAGTDKVLAFLAKEISTNTYLNLMDQYYPCYRADDNPPLDRPLSSEEYRFGLALAKHYGISRLDKQK